MLPRSLTPETLLDNGRFSDETTGRAILGLKEPGLPANIRANGGPFSRSPPGKMASNNNIV
jgi:hypothetical protein